MADSIKLSDLDSRYTAVTEDELFEISEYQGTPGDYESKKITRSILLGYKSYHFAPSQTTVTTTSGSLVVGKTYIILTVLGADDFSNVGFVATNTPFVATGTTPTVWANSTVVKNMTDSAPTNNELINDFGGTPTLSYIGPGRYDLTITGAFVAATKVHFLFSSILDYTISVLRMNDDSCRIFIDDLSSNGADGILDGTIVIEIRVYY